MYQDEKIICKICGEEFTFTAGEQEFYAEKGLENKPQRCKACRDARKNAGKPQREMFVTVCEKCGAEARLPFQPRPDRVEPILCSACHAERKQQQQQQ